VKFCFGIGSELECEFYVELGSPTNTIGAEMIASGECCQWVLDADSQPVEWLCQPLGFDSLALRQSLDDLQFA